MKKKKYTWRGGETHKRGGVESDRRRRAHERGLVDAQFLDRQTHTYTDTCIKVHIKVVPSDPKMISEHFYIVGF